MKKELIEKPSERIRKLFEASEKRYAREKLNTRKIASLLNVTMIGVSEILDELNEKIIKLNTK